MHVKSFFKLFLFLVLFAGLCLGTQKTDAQVAEQAQKSITGKVVDENGVGLAGVSITVKGTSKGTTSDSLGVYRISLTDRNLVLVFSSINYTRKEIKTGNVSTLNVQLAVDPKSKDMGEIVVVGYGTQRKVDLTGAVGSVTRKDIINKPFTSPDQILGGRISGVNIANRSGDPGAPIDVRIRGVGTVGNNQPLWVIDGVPLVLTSNITVNTGSFTESNPLASINPSDIETIDVLKDASAAAIYGARAANGVIIVTTKRGKEGRTSLTYDGYQGVQNIPKSKRIKVLDVPQFITLQKELGRDLSSFNGQPFVDWQDAVFIKNASVSNNNLSVSGGTKNVNFNVGGGIMNYQGLERGQSFKRISFKANSDFKVGKALKFGESVLLSSTNRGVQSEGGNFGAYNGSLNAPYFKIYDPTDPTGYNPFNNTTAGEGVNAANYVWATDARYNDTRIVTKKVLGSVYGEIELLKDLKYKMTLGVDYNVGDGSFFQEASDIDYGGGVRSSLLVQERPIELTTTIAHTLTYHKEFGKHDLTVLGGEEETNFRYDKLRLQGGSLFNSAIRFASVATTVAGANEADQWAIRGFLGRVNYVFNNKYLFTFNVRRDASSRFSKANRTGVFPSFSAGWRVSDEAFLRNSKAISDLKLRASWGQSGNQFTGQNFSYIPSLATTIFYVLGTGQNVVRGPAPIIFSNKNLKWETSTQLDFGADLAFLNKKLDVTIDYYKKTTKDVLLSLPIPYVSGYFLPADANIGEIQNTGIELSANYRNQVGNFRYSFGGNFTTVKNTVISLGGIPDIITGTGGAQTHRTTIGEPLGYFYGFKTDGIYQNDAEVAKALPDAYSAGIKPGDIRFVDVNGDGKIDAADRTKIGSSIPGYYYGFNLTGAYKGFDLSIFFQGVGNIQIYNQARSSLEGMNGGSNQSVSVLKRWSGPGTSNDMPRATIDDPNSNNRYSDRWIENGAYLRIKNLQLGYTFPSSSLQHATKSFVNASRIYIGISNLATFTKYKGYDPEVTRGASFQKGEFPLANGQDAGGSPQPTVVQVGWNITF